MTQPAEPTKRRLFVGGHMHGKVEAVPQNHETLVTVQRDDDGFNAQYTQVSYYLKAFGTGDTRMRVYVHSYSTTPHEILAALAQAAGVDIDTNAPPTGTTL